MFFFLNKITCCFYNTDDAKSFKARKGVCFISYSIQWCCYQWRSYGKKAGVRNKKFYSAKVLCLFIRLLPMIIIKYKDAKHNGAFSYDLRLGDL